MEKIQERDCRYDNIKALIMLGIVATHILGIYAPAKLRYFMIMMHMYDMPVFVWVSGRFASFKWKKMLKNYLYPYLLFQLLYLLAIRPMGEYQPIQFHQPYFLLWYLMAMMQWCLTVPLLKRIRGYWRWVFVAGTVVLALLVAYSRKIAFDWNLGRMFYYYPFFCAGYFGKNCEYRIPKSWKAFFAAGTAMILLVLYFGNLDLHVEWWYGADPYINGGAAYTPLHRIVMYVIAFVIGGCILSFMPSKRTFFTHIGQNVTPIYYWHGFVALYSGFVLKPYWTFSGPWQWWFFTMIVSVLLLVLLSTKPVIWFTQPFMSWPFTIARLRRWKGKLTGLMRRSAPQGSAAPQPLPSAAVPVPPEAPVQAAVGVHEA